MKKFLLLLVGVLFFVCNGVAKDWTIYCDTENNKWEQVYLFYSSTENISTDYYVTGEKVGTSTIFKFTFSTTGDYAKVNFSKSNTELKHDGTNGNGDYNSSNSNDSWKVFNNYLYVLKASSNGCEKLREYTEPTVPGETAEVNGTYVYFQKPSDWSAVAVHAWLTTNGDENCTAKGSWPGDEITSANTDGGYYFWAVPSDKSTPDKIIFNNNNNGNQTGNFDFVNGALYNADGKVADPSTQVIYFDANGTGWQSVKMSYRTAIKNEFIQGVAVNGKVGVYKFVFATALPTSAWTVKFTDGESPLSNKSGFENYSSGYVYKANGSNIEQAATTIEGYTPAVVKPTAYTIYFDTAGTAWNAATLTYADGQATVDGVAVEGKAGVFSFSFESTLTAANMSVKFANGDKSFSCATFTDGHIYKLYRRELKDGGEYTAEYAVTTPVETTIYFTTEGTGWTGVKIHYWNNFDQSLTGDWGTTAMTKVEGADNVWKYTIPADHMNVLCGIKFTDGYKNTEHETNTLYTDKVQAGHLYKINADWTVASQGLYTEPTTTYYYRLHGSIFTNGVKEDGGWYTQDCMTDNHDGTYSFTATIKAGSFGIKRLTSDKVGDINGGNTWINSPSSVTIEEGTEYAAQIKNNNGYDFKTDLSSEYTIIFNPTTMKVKIVSPTVTPKNYVWRLHTNIITGSWPAADNTLADYAMTKQEDGVTWVWEGRVSNSGFFGFKRLNEGDKPSNSTPWFYCNSNTDYTVALNTPSTGKLKANNSDTSGHDWQWNLPAGRYRIELNAADVNAPIIKIISLNTDYKDLVYVISGTFNGWTAPDTYLGQETEPFTFVYNSTSKVYEWSYTGTMKNVSFKISNMTDAATDNDPHWGKAFGYSYTAKGNVANLSLDATYQMRRTNVPGEDVFIDYHDTSNNPLTLVNPTFTLDPSNMTLVVKNNPKTKPTDVYYYLRGYWGGEGEISKPLTFVGDGTYVWEGVLGNQPNRFYISKSTSNESDTQSGQLTPKKSVYAEYEESETTFAAAQTGIKYECLWNTDEGDKTAKWAINVGQSNISLTGTYRVVFNPTAKTVVIYSLAPVTAQYEALEKSSDAGQAVGQAVNNLFVEFKPSEYLPVEATDSYSLQIGGKVVANGYVVNNETGLYRFDFMPYFVNDQELTLVASATKSADVVVKPADALDLIAKVGTVEYIGTKDENGTMYASINIPYTTECSFVYNFPHITYTRTDQEGSFEANVEWTTGGFTIVVPQAVVVNNSGEDIGKYTGDDVTFNFKFTPVIPFAVYTAPVGGTGSAAPAAPATNLTLQEFGGKVETFPLTISKTSFDVSGVEGVVIEAEDAPVEYYNLQGQRVNGDLAPGIYIRRQGTTVTKVRI